MSFASDPTYPLFPIFAFLGFFLVLTPLPWHFQAWNAGTCLYMIWAAIGCLNQFVNSVVWHGNALNPAPIWCDISTRILVGGAVAIPAASLCINRRLYKIATTKTLTNSRKDKRRAVIEDVLIGAGIPIVQMGLEYIVEGHRFDIYEDVGCYPAVYNVWLAYPLSVAWPIAIGLISAVYCILSIRAFIKRQAQFNELIANNSSLTRNRYFRLMALATTEVFCTIPFATFLMYKDLTADVVQPYKGWEDTHFNYSQVNQFPATIWRLDHNAVICIEMSRWLVVICAWIFFLFFGFADEARRHYRAAFLVLAKRLHIKTSWFSMERKQKPPPFSFVNAGPGVLPVFVARHVHTNRDSFNSEFAGQVKTESSLPLSPLSSASSHSVVEKKNPYDECYGNAL